MNETGRDGEGGRIIVRSPDIDTATVAAGILNFAPLLGRLQFCTNPAFSQQHDELNLVLRLGSTPAIYIDDSRYRGTTVRASNI